MNAVRLTRPSTRFLPGTLGEIHRPVGAFDRILTRFAGSKLGDACG